MNFVEYTKWDHYRWSYKDDEVVRLPDHLTPDQVHYRSWFTGGLERTPVRFRNECITTANHVRELSEAHGAPIRIMLSGGMDSEVTAWSFKLAAVPFELTFMKLADDLNRHEYAMAMKVAADLGHPLRVIHVDIHKIAKWSEEQEYSKFQAPISYSHRWLALQFPNDLAVWGCGDMVMNRDARGNSYVELGAGRHHCYDIYTGDHLPHKGVEQFLHYTPEQALSAYTHLLIQTWVESPRSMPFPFYGIKAAFYKTEFPEIKTDREKRTGAELIRVLESKFVDARKYLAPYAVRPQIKYRDIIAQLERPLSDI